MPNLKFALRTLFKTPFVTIVAIVSLALATGMSTPQGYAGSDPFSCACHRISAV
jgi:hypothetical protein